MSFSVFFSNIVIIIGIVIVNPLRAERLHEQIYNSVEGGAPCFRRLNGTHQVGCASTEKGTIGVVHMITNVDDAKWMIHNGSAGPYIGVVNSVLFHDIIDIFLQLPENVAGVVIYVNKTMQPRTFSLESRCPNEYSSAPGSHCSSQSAGGIVWNEYGNGLIRRDIPFPILFLPDTRMEEVIKINSCFQRFNLDKENQKGKPLCSLQLNSFMFASKDSELCIKRSASSLSSDLKICDPLGDQNVQYSLFPLKKDGNIDNRTITLVTARIDSSSLFDGLSPGGASSVVGMVTLITAAATLSKMIPVSDSSKYKSNILWTLLSGESFDYIGSQRVAYDLNERAWPPGSPIAPAQIRLHVELGQLGGSLRAHNDTPEWPMTAFIPYTNVPEQVESFLSYLGSNKVKATRKKTTNLPPSSFQSFRRILSNLTESGEMAELLLVDHGDTFTNMFYQSVYDDSRNVAFNYHNISIDGKGTFLDTDALIANGTMKETETQVKMARLATALAHSLYQQMTGNQYNGNITASAHLVDELLYCLLSSQACRPLAAADYAHSTEEEMPSKPAPLYVGVTQWNGAAPIYAGHLLALLTGVVLDANRTACNSMKNTSYSYYWLRGWNHTGICIQTTMNFSQAISPAFTIQDYDFKSGLYSTWTESIWRSMWARVFVSAGGGSARAAALAGATATIIAAFLTYWLHKHAQYIFMAPGNSVLVGNNDATAGILRTVNC